MTMTTLSPSIILKTAGNKIVITYCIYRPPGTNNAKYHQFQQILQSHLDTIQNEKVYVVGDFNINVKDSNNNMVQNYLLTLQIFYIYDASIATRPSANICLDHLHTKIQKQIFIQYVQYDKLDHLMMFVEIFDTAPFVISQQTVLSKSINNKKTSEYFKTNGLKCKNNYEDYIKTVNKLLSDNTHVKMCRKNGQNKKKTLDRWTSHKFNKT